MTIVDLSAERNRRAEPSPDCVRSDDFGRPLYTYLTEWTLPDGRQFGGEISACSAEDAEEHATAMRASLRVIGLLHERISQ